MNKNVKSLVEESLNVLGSKKLKTEAAADISREMKRARGKTLEEKLQNVIKSEPRIQMKLGIDGPDFQVIEVFQDRMDDSEFEVDAMQAWANLIAVIALSGGSQEIQVDVSVRVFNIDSSPNVVWTIST